MNEDTLGAIQKRNRMKALRISRRSNILRAVWLGCIAITILTVSACNTTSKLEMPTWTTVDFYDAIERNDAKQVREYLSDKKRATKEFLSYYLLDFALELEKDEIAQLMVEAGAGVNTLSVVQHENEQLLDEMLKRDVEPRGASLAAEQGNIHMLKALLTYGEDDLCTKGAARTGQIEAIEILLQHGAEPEGLGIAILHGHEDVAKLLLDAGANPNLLTRYNLASRDLDFDIPRGYNIEYLSPLHYAVLAQSLELVELLLENDADPNIAPTAVTLKENPTRTTAWPTVLQAATDLLDGGDARIANLLIENGATTTISVDDEDIQLEKELYSAANRRNYEAVIRLLEAGAEPTGFGDFYYGHSQKRYKPKIITAFFKAGADPNVYRSNGYIYTPTALTLQNGDIDNFRRFAKSGFTLEESLLSWYMKIACVEGMNEAIEILWNLGVSRGLWEILSPVSYGHVHTVEFLLAKGIRPKFLRHAVEQEHVEIAKMLLEAGADPNEPDDHDDRSILEIALELENEAITELLKQAGAQE